MKIVSGVLQSVFALCCVCAVQCATGDEWRARTLRIDTKVRFIDDDVSYRDRDHKQKLQSDELPFREPENTEGFYNRPREEGRYPVRSLAFKSPGLIRDPEEGTLDALRFCKCVSTPECSARNDEPNPCAPNKFLCCYKRSNRLDQKSEIFNEIEDERPQLLPGRGMLGGPFPHPHGDELAPGHNPETSLFTSHEARPILVGPGGPTGQIGPNYRKNNNEGILVGPNGPTGQVGPNYVKNIDSNRGILVGPGGPTGQIGPNYMKNLNNRGILVGPEGPTGIIGPLNGRPNARGEGERAVLVGPNGPTGIIRPSNMNENGILVGPGGPTGVIGPQNTNVNNFSEIGTLDGIAPSESAQRGVLVGPGGPTGIIGPNRYRPFAYGRQGRFNHGPGILVGPGGPTGIIGPGRQLLVGPGGPTGIIGPRGGYGK